MVCIAFYRENKHDMDDLCNEVEASDEFIAVFKNEAVAREYIAEHLPTIQEHVIYRQFIIHE